MTQTTMLGVEEERERKPDLYNLWLHETHDLPQGWAWYMVSVSRDDVPEGFILFEGGVAPLPITRGPRKGLPNWDLLDKRTVRRLFGKRADFEAWKEVHGERENECPECRGEGEVLLSWSKAEGRVMTTCKRCEGDGTYHGQGER